MDFAGFAGHLLNIGQGGASGSDTSMHQGSETGDQSIFNDLFKHLVLTIWPCILPCSQNHVDSRIKVCLGGITWFLTAVREEE